MSDEPLVTDWKISGATTRANALSIVFQLEASGPRRVTLERDAAKRLAADLEQYLRTFSGSSPTKQL